MNFKSNADFWLSCYGLDKKLKREIKNMTPAEMEDAFGSFLEFGTGGLRGILGAGTNRMNIYIVRKATLGFGKYLIKNVKNALKRGVCISFDNRHMSREFSQEAAHVLTSLGFEKVFLYNELRPTPQLSWTVRYTNACAGIMITASHNPKNYNGYKVYNEDGCQLNLEESNKVIEEINSIENIFSIKVSENWKNIHYIYDEFDELYLNDVSKISINKNLKKDFKITYTPLHGTGGTVIPKFLKSLGYDINPVNAQMIVDPNFSSCGSSNPENEVAFNESKVLGFEIGAKLLLATDPDADRLGVGVLHNDEYVLLSGNETAAILFNYICEQNKILNHKWPKRKSYLFSTIVSSSLTTKIASKYKINTELTLTGFKFIGEQIKLIEKKADFIFGYEESYGCLISSCVRDKDSVQACLMLCEACAYYLEKGKTLVDVLDDIYNEFGYYKSGIANLQLEGVPGRQKIIEIMNHFRNEEISLDGFKILTVSDYKEQIKINKQSGKITTLSLPKSNVIKFELEGDSWFVLRPSGTEPKLKIYVEALANNSQAANLKVEDIKGQILDIINKL